MPITSTRSPHVVADLVCQLTSLAHLSAQQQLPTTTLDKCGHLVSISQLTGSTLPATEAPSKANKPESPAAPADSDAVIRFMLTVTDPAQLAQLPPAIAQLAIQSTSFAASSPTLAGSTTFPGTGKQDLGPSASSALHIPFPLRLSFNPGHLADLYQTLLVADCERLSTAIRNLHATLHEIAIPPFDHDYLKSARLTLDALTPEIINLTQSVSITAVCLAASVHPRGTGLPQAQESVLIRAAYVAAGVLEVVKVAKKVVAAGLAANAAHKVKEQVSDAANKVKAFVAAHPLPSMPMPGRSSHPAETTTGASNQSAAPASGSKRHVPKLLNLVKQLQMQHQQQHHQHGSPPCSPATAATSPAGAAPTTKLALMLDSATARFVRSMHLLLDIVIATTVQYKTNVEAKLRSAPSCPPEQPPFVFHIPLRQSLTDLIHAGSIAGGSNPIDATMTKMIKSLSDMPLGQAVSRALAKATAGSGEGGMIIRTGSGGVIDCSPGQDGGLVTVPRAAESIPGLNQVGVAVPSAPPMPMAVMSAEQYAALSIPRHSRSSPARSNSLTIADPSAPLGIASNPLDLAERLYPTIQRHGFNPDNVPAFPIPLQTRLGTFALLKTESDERLGDSTSGGASGLVQRLVGKSKKAGKRNHGWNKVWIELDLTPATPVGAVRYEVMVFPLVKIRVHGEDGEVREHLMADTSVAPTCYPLKHATIEHAKDVTSHSDVLRIRLVSGKNLLVHVGSQRKDTWMHHLRSEAGKATHLARNVPVGASGQ